MTWDEIHRIKYQTSKMVYSTRETHEHSFEIGSYVEHKGIEGAVIECGIASGGNFASMILGVLSENDKPKRKFIGFDSFEGIQLAGSKDTVQAGIGEIKHDTNVSPKELLKTSGITVHPKLGVEGNLKSWGLLYLCDIELVEGWVQNTITEAKAKQIGKIAVLRLDMDIYDPTLHTLKMLYDNISVGGVIIIDDWNLKGVQVAVEEFWQLRGISPEIHKIHNSEPIYWYK